MIAILLIAATVTVLLLAGVIIWRLAVDLLAAQQLIETQRAAIILDEEHITLLKETHDIQAETIAQLAGRNDWLEGLICRHITHVPDAKSPRRIEELRDRLAARSMN